jgi:hypothetical protein
MRRRAGQQNPIQAPRPQPRVRRLAGALLSRVPLHSLDFDDFSRDLARGLPRREVLRRLGGGLTAWLLASLGIEQTWAAPSASASPGPCDYRDVVTCVQDKTFGWTVETAVCVGGLAFVSAATFGAGVLASLLCEAAAAAYYEYYTPRCYTVDRDCFHGTTCTADPSDPQHSYCCNPGQVVCRGGCYDPSQCSGCASGGVCDSFSPCPGNSNSDCFCADTAEGTSACVLNQLCRNAPTCSTSGDCPAGLLCIVDTCCGDSRCVAVCDTSAAGVARAVRPRHPGPTLFRR